MARAKVSGTDCKQYIIQNNNWGSPSGSDQTISYNGNSFKVTASSGTGSSAPASFPSIFQGRNGQVQNGAFSTEGTDNMPILNQPAQGGGTPAQPPQDYSSLSTPSVWRTARSQSAAAKVEALSSNGMDEIEIPAFLRKQAD